MKALIVAAAGVLLLTGCVAVPAPYYPDAYYYPAPAVGVGIYAAPGYYYGHAHPRRYYGPRYWR
jgi:hypothetical protein